MISTSLDFYNENKHIPYKLPAPPDENLNDYQLCDWLLNRSDFSWLELDVQFDVDKWQKEILSCKDFLVPHRDSESSGWESACIHGIDIQSTGAWTRYGYKNEDDVPYHWTELADQCPNIKKFWSEFPYDSYRRIRIMAVKPGGCINPHSDMPGKLPGEENFDALKFGVPINVAVIHPKECYMSLKGHGVVPFKEGKAFLINIRNYHSVINFSDEIRYHIIAHGKLQNKTDKFVKLISDSFRKQFVK
jgi:hypothetical protein